MTFKNNASFTSCIPKINNTLIDNAEDLDIVMPMYHLLESSKNYSKGTGSLSNYYRGVNHSNRGSKSFDYKTSKLRKLKRKEN